MTTFALYHLQGMFRTHGGSIGHTYSRIRKVEFFSPFFLMPKGKKFSAKPVGPAYRLSLNVFRPAWFFFYHEASCPSRLAIEEKVSIFLGCILRIYKDRAISILRGEKS